ncbi:ubiquitin-protein ligase dscA [Aspergillus clavatus NRRL 1]|uniref:DSC E3 ubiquitin ligase complex subunit A n=1 Tax=Aspergillus clavatus (strain ATCC 1007 / CBS 513.65 / DSM 816 / NCTC 3887 / NRRL 1 / QM 1276 / 107) TaxID=344612 RepID=A1CPR3_ASPCL|nr:RING finger ubiquitin ligase (Tul1), putative [Aspergillus clavatus NRRL 1]EAW07634.1 RING finger ubiquitin ligase (Tul1), putative [Aspergillus clavatus NRRL 1]
MDNRGSFFFFLIVFYLLLSSQSRPPLIDQDREHQREVARERDALRLLNETNYGDFDPQADKWLPFTGVRKNDSYAWDILPHAQDRARHQLRNAILDAGLEPPKVLEDPEASPPLNFTQLLLPVYRNVTGKLRGEWVRRKQDGEHPKLNTTAIALENEYFTHEFSLNITGSSGTFYLDLREGGGEELRVDDGHVREIRATLAVESDDLWENTWYLSLFGVHFPESGGIILTSTSEKYGGLFALPHLTLSPDAYELSHRLLMKSLSDTLSEKANRPPTLFPWPSLVGSEQVEFPAPKCEHVVYIQQHPVSIHGSLADKPLIDQIEQELRYPIGAPIPSAPLMVMSAVVFSPDCGYILETKGTPDFPPSEALYLSGPKIEEFGKYSARLVFLVCGVFAAQITLLLRQIKEASTPSTRSRISFYTIALMAIGDAFVLVFILLELYPSVSFLVMTTASFLTFLSVSYIGMKFMMEIWAVQAPERREQERRSNPTPNQRTGGLPLPATMARDTGATPIIVTPDQDPPAEENDLPTNRGTAPTAQETRNDVGAMYARFYFTLFVMLIISIWSFLWPNRLGALYARALAFVYLSFWVPQIGRNVMRNCRKALRWDFVVGQSLLRLFPFIYFLTVRGNVLFVRPDTTTAMALAGWIWAQVWILASQDILGPRFFVPRGWAPPAYDYHPVLRDSTDPEADLESGGVLPIGALRADERDISTDSKDGEDKPRSKDRKKAVFDCAICMQEIEVPVLAALGAAGGSSVTDGATSILSRRTYMITPCRHIFHSTCLESWMRLRLQCPICRESIPPV